MRIGVSSFEKAIIAFDELESVLRNAVGDTTVSSGKYWQGGKTIEATNRWTTPRNENREEVELDSTKMDDFGHLSAHIANNNGRLSFTEDNVIRFIGPISSSEQEDGTIKHK